AKWPGIRYGAGKSHVIPQIPGGIVASLQQGVFRIPQTWLVLATLLTAACGANTPTTPSGAQSAASSTATSNGSPTTITSGAVTVTSVTVTCTQQAEGDQCAAVAGRSDGSTQPVTAQVAWTSSNTSVATVDQSGLVRHRTTGQTEIRA